MGGITTIINKVKYIGIASLTIAILSVLILNLISSYSNSHIQSKAEPISNSNANANLSTLANGNDLSICDPSNTNAASCIRLSITSSSSSSSTGGNDANLSLSIPQGGGIATGRHTVEVSSNNVTGYYVMLTGNAGSPAMTPSATTSQAFIQSTTGTLANPTYLDKGQWGSWGVALPNSSLYTGFNTNEMDYSSTDQDVLHKTTWAAVPGKESDDSDKTIIKTTASSKKTDTYPIYYGVRVDSPVSVPADTYAAQVVYTATTNEVPMPTITSTSSNTYELGSGADSTVTITGTNLSSTYSVYLTNTNGDKVGDCTNLSVADDTQLTCTVPTDQTNPDLEPGDYTIHVVTQGGEGTVGLTYNDQINSVAVDYGDGVGHVQVDYDKNMIPVYYNGSQWMSLSDSMIESNPSIWFDYTGNSTNGDGSHWANAVTIKKETLSKYQNKDLPIDESDVLGYWVYIPRYAYQVMRRDVSNEEVTDDEAIDMGGFSIRFETKDDFKKTPVQCAISTTMSYLDCVDPVYPREERLANQTAWATHPAFTWQYTQDINGFDKTYELNGFWIGKFETTGTRTAPTVKPNQHANISEYVGEFYSASKSIGVEDKNNQYGGASSDDTTSSLKQNSHNLAISTSHMLKNSEWGAVAYLSASKYGAGVNNVQINSAYPTSSTDADGTSSRYSVTGCGPSSNGSTSTYTDGTALNASTIESPTACSRNTARAYNGSLGVLASTTNNVYGVYDMSGGAWEYVMGNYSTNLSQTSNSSNNYGEVKTPIKPPYVDLYNITSNNSCTWNTSGSGCGGHALFETASWGGDYSVFVDSSSPWFERGGGSSDVSYAGVFASRYLHGDGDANLGFRAALLAVPQG